MATNLKKKVNGNNFNEVVEEIESERNAAPTLGEHKDEYKMLAGYRDENGVLHDTFALRPMTGEDEEYLARFKNSPMAKIITMLLERCVESIGSINQADVKKKDWHDIIDNLYVADQDYMMMRLREISIGEELEIVHRCPECNQSIKTILTVDELNVIDWDGEDGIEFELPRGYTDSEGKIHKTGIIRYPRGIDREATVPIASKNGARGRTIMLSRLCEFDDGTKMTEDIMRKLTLGDRNYLDKLLAENQFGLDMSVDVECPNCGNNFSGGLNATNFI